MRDLGLTYEQAMHGVQSAIRFEMSRRGYPDEVGHDVMRMLKHLRVGVDARAADTAGLAELLIAKGVFTAEEYVEHVRLGMNDELARYEQYCREEYDLPPGAQFR